MRVLNHQKIKVLAVNGTGFVYQIDVHLFRAPTSVPLANLKGSLQCAFEVGVQVWLTNNLFWPPQQVSIDQVCDPVTPYYIPGPLAQPNALAFWRKKQKQFPNPYSLNSHFLSSLCVCTQVWVTESSLDIINSALISLLRSLPFWTFSREFQIRGWPFQGPKFENHNYLIQVFLSGNFCMLEKLELIIEYFFLLADIVA